MDSVTLNKTYQAPPLDRREILRYAGCKSANEATASLLEACLQEVQDQLTYQVCYRVLPLTTEGALCNFGAFKLHSQNLAANLKGCKEALLFAATVGVGIDRLIAKYGRLSPAKALMLQAIGAQQIEALCDLFCKDLAQELQVTLKPRFSPGYGDLPLSAQRDILALLDCGKRIGLTLNDSLLLSPTKSVTAFAGIENK